MLAALLGLGRRALLGGAKQGQPFPPSQEAKERLLSKPEEELTEFEQGVLARIDEPVKSKKDELAEMSCLKRILFSPRGALIIMVVFFTVDTIVVGVCRCNSATNCDKCALNVMDMVAYDRTYPQYTYGIAAYCFILVVSLAFVSYWLGETRLGECHPSLPCS